MITNNEDYEFPVCVVSNWPAELALIGHSK